MDDAARRGPDAGLYAGRDGGDRQGADARSAHGGRRADGAGQHLSSGTTTGTRRRRRIGRPAPADELERPDFDRQRRLSSLQSGQIDPRRRRTSRFPLAHRRKPFRAVARNGHPHSRVARGRLHHVSRRMPAARRRARNGCEAAVDRTTRWAARCKEAQRRSDQALFGIVQGGTDPLLRERSAEGLLPLAFPGYAIGGLGVGEEPAAMYAALDSTVPLLPADRPRYLMGVGRPIDLVEGVLRGVDLFDCVMPTRNGRNATAFTSRGLLRLRNACHQRDPRPLDEECGCPVCRQFSRGYLRHLFLADEMLGPILLSLHNVAFYQRLMADLRAACRADRGSRLPLPSACSLGDVRLRLRRKRRFPGRCVGLESARHAADQCGKGKESHGRSRRAFSAAGGRCAESAGCGGGADGGASGFLSFMAPLFLIAIIFYFLLIRPQKREREKQDQAPQGTQEKRPRGHDWRRRRDDRQHRAGKQGRHAEGRRQHADGTFCAPRSKVRLPRRRKSRRSRKARLNGHPTGLAI